MAPPDISRFPRCSQDALVSDRLLVAHGPMFLRVVGPGTAIWWNVHHSQRQTYPRQKVREGKKAAAAEPVRSASGADGRDRA